MAANNQRFEQLKQKYQSVTNAMWQVRVRLQNVNMQGDKLFIRGEAPSQEAKFTAPAATRENKTGPLYERGRGYSQRAPGVQNRPSRQVRQGA